MSGQLIFTIIAIGVVIYGVRQDMKDGFRVTPACLLMGLAVVGLWLA